jgi:CotS family spore coat protein
MGKRKEEKELLEVFDLYGADPEILREWDLAVEKIKPVRGVLRIKTSSGTRMLKKVTTSESRLRFIHGAIEHLASNGLPNVSRFIRTKYGDPYVVAGQELYYLTDWLPGKEADLKKTKNLFLAAETLARLHIAGAGYEGGGFGQETREDFSAQWGRFRAKLESYDEALEDRRDEFTAMDQLYGQHRAELRKMIDHAESQLVVSPYGQILEWAREHRTICHGSFTRQNLIIDNERMGVIDFDHCHYGHPIHDVGALLARYMPRYQWDAEIGFSILDVYRAVREVTHEEVTVLAAYLAFPQRTLSVVEAYFEGTKDWDAGRFASRFRKSLVLDHGRETFVQDLIDRYGLSMSAPSFAPHIEGIDAYEDLAEMESSSVESRNDGWEEARRTRDELKREEEQDQDEEEEAPQGVSVRVDEEDPSVALASHDDEEAPELEESASVLRHPNRYKLKRSKTEPPRRRNDGGPWTPGRR